MSLLSWRPQVRNLKSQFINLVFPPVCVHCGKVGALICEECLAMVAWVEAPVCAKCGRPVSRPIQQCAVCRKRPLPLKQIRAALLFKTVVPGMIHHLKYRNAFALAEPLGDLMVQAWPRWQTHTDLILPIPLHAKRRKKRGYNQSELLVNQLCLSLSITTETRLLQRTRHTPPQVGLNAVDRQTNVKGAFSVTDPEKVKGREILLVDDVFTTGATLKAAADALTSAGAKSVSAYCLARAL
jgi:ComF family protein